MHQRITLILASEGQHSFWPGPLGFAAAGDTEACRGICGNCCTGMESMLEFVKSTGIRRISQQTHYGQELKIHLERILKLAADMIYKLSKVFKAKELGTDSVAITVKHFPGGGARDDGMDPHFVNGKFNPYPTEGSILKYHIPPFEAAIEAGCIVYHALLCISKQ